MRHQTHAPRRCNTCTPPKPAGVSRVQGPGTSAEREMARYLSASRHKGCDRDEATNRLRMETGTDVRFAKKNKSQSVRSTHLHVDAAGQHLGDLREGYSPLLQPSHIAGPTIPSRASILPPPPAGCCCCCYGAIAKENESDTTPGCYNNRAPKCHLVIPPPKKQTSASASPAVPRWLLLEFLPTSITAYHFLSSSHPRIAAQTGAWPRESAAGIASVGSARKPKTRPKNIFPDCALDAGRKIRDVRSCLWNLEFGTPLSSVFFSGFLYFFAEAIFLALIILAEESDPFLFFIFNVFTFWKIWKSCLLSYYSSLFSAVLVCSVLRPVLFIFFAATCRVCLVVLCPRSGTRWAYGLRGDG